MSYPSTAHDELLELEDDDEFLDGLIGGGQDGESDGDDAPGAA